MTAVEFAFVLPPLLLLTCGILEFGVVFMASNVLENAVNNASRIGKTGFSSSGISREQMILNAVGDRIDNFLDPALLTLTTRVYRSFDQIGQAEPYTDSNHNGTYDLGETYTDSNSNGQWDQDMGAEGVGNANEVVVYDISYPWKMMTPLLKNVLADDGNITLSTRMVVKNEPFGGG